MPILYRRAGSSPAPDTSYRLLWEPVFYFPFGKAIMQLVHLESIDDPQVEAYTNLTELQLRNRLEPSKGIFIAESPKVITRALAAGRQPISLLVEEPWIEGMADIFAFIDEHWGDDIPVYVASPEQLRRITGYRLHRGALAAMHRWELPTVAEVCANATRIAVLENIVPHQRRSHHAFGSGVGCRCGAGHALMLRPLYRRAIRVSMGTVFQVPWTRIGAMTCTTGHGRVWRNCMGSASPPRRWRYPMTQSRLTTSCGVSTPTTTRISTSWH